MRLLVVGSNYPPHTLGGYELLCAEHVRFLVEAGHEVTVLTTWHGLPGPSAAFERGAAGESVVRALDFQWADFVIRRLRGRRLVMVEWRQRRTVRRLLRRQRPHCVLVWHMAAVSKSVLEELHRAGVPVVAVVGEPWPVWDVTADAWLSLWSRPAVRRTARLAKPVLRRLADRLVAPVTASGALASLTVAYASDHLRAQVEERVPELRGHGTVVPNGIDLGRFPDPGRGHLADPVRLLYLGRVERRKGVATAVEAVGVLASQGVDARLDMVGWSDETYVAEMRATAARLGVAERVAWLPPVRREEVAAVYASHDILLFPVLWEEPFGLVPLEAMATGCLCVATGRGGSAEYMRDGENVLLHPPEDAAGLAACVVRLRDDPALAARLRAAGRATAAEHSFVAYARSLERLALVAAGRDPASAS